MSESLLVPSQTLAVDPSTSDTTTPSSSTSNSNTATATVLQNIPPALFFIVPAFSVALFVLAITNRPQHGSSGSRVQARIAYALVASLGVLSTVAGAIPLSKTGLNSDLRSEKVVEAFVSLLLGVPVLHLASTRPRRQSARSHILGILHTGALALTLSSATLLALLVQFLPVSASIPPALFLVFSVLALPRLAQALLLHASSRSTAVHFLTHSPSKTSWFFRGGTSPHLKSASTGSRRKPITIHVATQRTSTSYPLSLPSPSSSNSFPLSESVSSYEHERLELGRSSLRPHNYNQQGGEIELEISLPCRDSDTERDRKRNSQGYSYHDLQVEYSPDHIGRHSEEKYQLGRRQEHKHKVELHRSSVDSSSSTLTTNTDRKHERTSSFNRVLTPPLTRIRLPTIASAGSSNVELQYSNSTSNQGIIGIGSVPSSIRFGNLFDSRSTRSGRATSIQAGTASASTIHHHHGQPYHGGLLDQLRFTRTRSCFLFLIAAQVTALVAYACAIGVEVGQSGVIVQAAPQGFKEPNWGTLTLRIVQTACTVLSVTGTMSAYFLHAYNAHFPLSTGAVDVHTHDHAPNGTVTINDATTAVITSGSIRPPKPAGSRAMSPNSRFSDAVGISTNTTGATMPSTFEGPGEEAISSHDAFASSTDNAHSNAGDAQYIAGTQSYAYAGQFDGGGGYEGVEGGVGGNYANMPEIMVPARHTSHDPTIIVIEPLSHTRKRVDAMTGGGHQKSSIPMPLMDPPSTGGVDASVSAGSGFGSPLSRQERELSSNGPSGSATGRPFTHLTYVPPHKADDHSLFQTDTEVEGDVRSEDPEFDTEKEDGFQENEGRMGLDEWEQSTGVMMLSRSKSTVSGGGGTRPVRGRVLRRASVGVGGCAVNHSIGKEPESTSATTTTPYSPSGSSPPRTKSKSKPADDPSVYIRRRGSVPAPSAAKKFFGWEFGWDSVPAEKKVGGAGGSGLRRSWTERVGAGSKYSRARERAVDNAQQEQESSFIDLKAEYGIGRSVGLGLGSSAGGGGKEGREIEVGSGGVGEAGKSQIERGPRRKLTKRSKSATTTESAIGPLVSRPKRISITRPLSVALAAAAAAPRQTVPTSTPRGGAFTLGRLGHRRLASGSSIGTANSQASKVSCGSASTSGRDVVKGGLQLKKNFKLGVGRTLGPNLTLAVGMASSNVVRGESITRKERAKRRTSSVVAESIPEGEGGDHEEMLSAAGATIHATSTSAGDFSVKGRPTLAAIITSLPSSSGYTDVAQHPFSAPGLQYSAHTPLTASSPTTPTSWRTASNKWKSHPFADFLESKGRNHIAEEDANDVENDVVQLEHEMEAIRGRRGDNDKDSPRKLHVAGGKLQKRLALSSPPAPNPEWTHQPSSAPTMAGGFRFPMIFGNDSPSSSMYQHAQQSSSQVRLQGSISTPSTPRGQSSTMRLSAVRNAFAGVGARMSSRMSVNSNAASSTRGGGGSTFNEMVMESNDGDFMDLRDPFASPPAAATLVTPTKKPAKNGGRAKEGDNFLVIDAYGPDDVEGGDVRRRMSAWGKLPMPTRPFSPAAIPGTSTTGSKRNTNNNNRSGRSGAKAPVGHRKQKKERRARKTTLPSMASALGAMKGVALRVGEEDADFGIEEALLSQRLLRRLDADGWESRA